MARTEQPPRYLLARVRSALRNGSGHHLPVIAVNEPEEEAEIAAADTAGIIGPDTIVVVLRQFADGSVL
jgi:hypothetical protein